MSSLVWFITGCSSGFGAGLARTALKAGHRVIATSRNPSKSPEIIAEIENLGGTWLVLDVCAPNTKNVIEGAIAIYGQIDVFVNNAGYSAIGAFEDFNEAELRQQMETNFFGPVNLIRAVLPSMRERKSGTIVNISSAAAIHNHASCALYAASKCALEGKPHPVPTPKTPLNPNLTHLPLGFSESLSRELSTFSIQILIVQPGAFRTPFLSAAITPKAGHSALYAPTAVGTTLACFAAMDGTQLGDTDRGCKAIFDRVTRSGRAEGLTPFLRLPLGSDAAGRMQGKVEEWRDTLEGSRELWESSDFR